MSDCKGTESSKLNVGDVLADFFVKKMVKKHEHKSRSNEKKHKKHKKKSKKKNLRRSSSFSDRSDYDENNYKHKSKHSFKKSDDRHQSHSRSSDHKKRKKPKSRSNSIEESKHNKSSSLNKTRSSSNSGSETEKKTSDQKHFKQEWTEKVKNDFKNMKDDWKEKCFSESTVFTDTINSEMAVFGCLEKEVKEEPKLKCMEDSSNDLNNQTNKTVLNVLHSEIPISNSSSLYLQSLPPNKPETQNINIEKDENIIRSKSNISNNEKDIGKLCGNSNVEVREVMQKTCSEIIFPQGENSDSRSVKPKSSNCILISIIAKPDSIDKVNTSFKSSHQQPILKSDSVQKDVDNNKLKQKLSGLKRQELLEKFTKHEEMYKDLAITKSRKKHKFRDNYEKKTKKSDSRNHSSKKEKYRSKHESRDSRDDFYSEKKDYKSYHRKSKERSEQRCKKSPNINWSQRINKAKLLEVARKNALAMMEKGTLPQGISSEVLKKEHVVSIKAGGKSVKELTDFCRNLSSKEDMGNAENSTNVQEGTDQPFIHHPFKLKEASTIKLNIKNSVQLPVKSHAEKVTENARTLSLQFPVSSGNQHRQKESEWIPVEKNVPRVRETAVALPHSSKLSKASYAPQQISLPKTVPSTSTTPPFNPPPSFASSSVPLSFSSTEQQAAMPSYFDPAYSTANFRTHSNGPIDVHAVVAKRCNALERLKLDPNDVGAANDLSEANSQFQAWIESKHLPGQFTGSTNAKLLSAEELCGPRPVWVKKDAFTRAAPVTEGKGMSLLRKMGWNPGEGLGKNKEGSLEPLLLDIKTDKKGLVSIGESGKRMRGPQTPIPNINKHPVSVLMELCSKRKWEPPLYTVVNESGPPHKKVFLFKVQVNNREYQPSVSRQSKKQAKAEAAELCLKLLGVPASEYKMP